MGNAKCLLTRPRSLRPRLRFLFLFFSGFRHHGAHGAHVHHVSGSPDPETDPLSDAKGPDIFVARSAELRRGLESGLR